MVKSGKDISMLQPQVRTLSKELQMITSHFICQALTEAQLEH